MCIFIDYLLENTKENVTSKGMDFIVFILKEHICFKAVHTEQDE